MSEHTKGQITIIEHSWSDTGLYVDGNQIALISIESEATEENQDQLEKVASANARRLAAAWNVCEGMPTDDIEELAACHGVMTLTVYADDMLAELNAARALLREVLEAVDSRAKEYTDRGLEVAEVPEIARIRNYLDACDKPGEQHAS